MAKKVKSIRAAIGEAIGYPEGNSRQMPVSNTKVSISNAVPLCLPNNYTWDSVTKKISVDKTNTRKSLTVCTEGLELLESLKDQLVVVLCIAGPARSGKSFFASQLLEDVNFDVGHGAGSHTTGIWIGVGAKPVSWSSDKARVVILDAEGLGGVNTDSSNTDAKWEHKIFSLCVLLSSCVIYNSKGPPNNDELDKLGFIAEFSRSICPERQDDVEEQKTPSEGLGQFGPDFLWLFRDILCTPDLNGQPCDWTKFVKKALLDPKPNEPERNHIRKSISSTFRTIQAADIPPPTFDSKAVKNLLGEENKYKINQNFLPRIEEVAQNMLSSVQVKNIKGSKLTGSQLIDMLLHVVDRVNSECDKLDVTSMWDSIVNAEMQRYIQRALHIYKEKMEQVKLPEEEDTYLALHESTKDSSKHHFQKVTTRFDKDICSSQLQVLCHKIETEFNNSFLKKNEQASLRFNDKLNTDLEKEYFNNLPAKPSCMQLKIANTKVNDCYKEKAKGPKAEQVKSETQLQRGQKIGRMRTESLIYAEQQSCELFERSLKEALEGETLTFNKLTALKETCIKDCFTNFRKATCDEVDCTPCMKSKQSVGQEVESIFKTCSSECYNKSKEVCQSLINELMKIKLVPFVENIDSHNYSDFLKIKSEILVQYDQEAKGLAKEDLMGTCTKTIDMHNEGIQLLIIQSALKSVSCTYTQLLIQTTKSDPCEAEELDIIQAIRSTDMISKFKVKCACIDESKLEPYLLNLEDVIKNFTTLIANENKSRSINLCEELVTSLSRKFHDGILQTHIPKIRQETEYGQCSHPLKMAEEFKNQILNDYKQRARGPEKERFQESLNEYMEILLTIVKNVVNEMILKTVLRQHFDQLDIVKQKYPISENELRSAISETNNNTEKVFLDAQKQISLPFVSCSKDILSIILDFDTMQLVEENYKESMRQLDEICKDISLESQMKCKELVDGGADTFTFAKIRDDCTKEFEISGKGVLKDHYKSILQGNVDLEIRIAHTTIADNSVKRIFAYCRTAIENLVQRNPREQYDLENDIKRVKEDATKKIVNLQKEVEEAKIAGTEESLTIELKDTISYVHGKNLRISSEKCSAQLREVFEELKGYCKTFLESETSAIDDLIHFKDEYLRQYDQAAIGPAKAKVRETLEPEIVEEVDRTFVLFAKAKYRIILREEIQTYQFLDLLNNPEPERIEQLIQLLITKVRDILNTYPTLGRTTRNILTRDLEESINPSLLNEIITAYGMKITQLGYRGILEGDELENEIASAKNGLFEILRPRILGINGRLPEESQTFIDNVETSFKKENLERSRINCQETFDSLFEYYRDYLTKKYFRKMYDEKCKGPAKQTVWDENEARVDEYYNSYRASFRKVWSPFRFISHKFYK